MASNDPLDPENGDNTMFLWTMIVLVFMTFLLGLLLAIYA